MDALSTLSEEVPHLQASFDPTVVFGGVTQYILWMVICWIITLVLILVVGRKLTLIPTNKFVNTVEYGYQFVRNDMGEGIIGHGFKKHVPFLATLFFFILIANVVGLIPGAKATTGTISITWALAAISFVYFNFYGLKTLGVFGYIKSLVPSGVPGPMVPIIWFLEFFSMVIRVLTLAVRLYGNMLAGHMVLAVFSLATTVFLQQAVFSMDFVTALPAVAWFVLLVLMYAMECLVAFLQAYVFTILSASYIGMAVHPH